jgi:hypothetical protein
MPSLHDTQARVMAGLRHAGAVPGAATLLRDRRGLAATQRLQVYRHNMEASLGNALVAVYPVVTRLVGADFFRQLARGYLRTHPSHEGNLHGFGDGLPGYLRADPSVSALPYLGDVAALEWAIHEVYHEADGATLDGPALAGVAPTLHAGLRLELQPATRFVSSAWPVLAIWNANQATAPEDVAPVSLDAGGVRLLVARDAEGDVEFRLLDAAEGFWLEALARGRPLGLAVAAALAVDASFDFGAALGRHLALGTFSGFATPLGTDVGGAT